MPLESITSLVPKYRNSNPPMMCVYFRGRRLGRMRPIMVERMVMTMRARKAPRNTALRSFRMERTAAMKKVLSPISVATIIATPAVNPLVKLRGSSPAPDPPPREGTPAEEGLKADRFGWRTSPVRPSLLSLAEAAGAASAASPAGSSMPRADATKSRSAAQSWGEMTPSPSASRARKTASGWPACPPACCARAGGSASGEAARRRPRRSGRAAAAEDNGNRLLLGGACVAGGGIGRVGGGEAAAMVLRCMYRIVSIK